MSEYELIESREVHRGKMIDVRIDRVRTREGSEVDLELVVHPGAVAVVAVTDDGDVVLVRQFRYAIGEWILEVPAGKLERGEQPEACAARELEEETGLSAGCVQPLGSIWTTPGFTDERIWLFLATDLHPTRQSLEADEVLTVERLPLRDAIEAAESGELQDAKTICALFQAARRWPA